MSSPLKFLPLKPKQIVRIEYHRGGHIRTIIQNHSYLQSLTRFYGWACRCSSIDIEQRVSTIDHAPESGGQAVTDPMLGTDRELIGH